MVTQGCIDLGYGCPQQMVAHSGFCSLGSWHSLALPFQPCFSVVSYSYLGLHLSLVRPELRCGGQWGEERVAAHVAGALPALSCTVLALPLAWSMVRVTHRQISASVKRAGCVKPIISFALQGRKQEKPWEQPSLVGTDKPQLSPPYSKLPHTSSPGSSPEDSGNDSPAPGLSPSPGPGASDSPGSRSPEEAKEEEDALKYVREIFFS